MSSKKIIIGLLLAISMPQFQQAESEKAVFGCRGWGFFAEFLWVINHLDWAIKNNKKPVVYWGQNFAYFSSKGFHGQTNAWEYYFSQTSDGCYQVGDKLINPPYHKTSDNFSALWYYAQYIVNLTLLPEEERSKCIKITNHNYYKQHARLRLKYPFGERHLYDPRYRAYIKSEIIDRYIKLQPWVANKIDQFYRSQMKGYTVIGIHLRGKFLASEVGTVPLDVIFETANQLNDGTCIFFIATDQQPLLEQAQRKLNGKVIFYETQRYGKTTSPKPKMKHHPKMGEDVLIETLLLSHCDYLVHTLSNVSTAALHFNPSMDHTLLY